MVRQESAKLPFTGANPVFGSNTPLAQLAEQGTLNAWVEGSSPSWCITHPRCSVIGSTQVCGTCSPESYSGFGILFVSIAVITPGSDPENGGPIPSRTTIAGVSAYT